jgi:tetratricopeptide (TPR) repeat protein
MRLTWVAALAAGVVLSLLSPAARGQPDAAKDIEARAFERYKAGEYEAALADYKEAYRLERDPGLLFNVGLCYAKLGLDDEARAVFLAVEEKAPADHPVRPRVAKQLAKLKSAPQPAASAPSGGSQPTSAAASPGAGERPVAAPPPTDEELRELLYLPIPEASLTRGERWLGGAALVGVLGLSAGAAGLVSVFEANRAFEGGDIERAGALLKRERAFALIADGLLIAAAAGGVYGFVLKRREGRPAVGVAPASGGAVFVVGY